jgi:hypothetical protein
MIPRKIGWFSLFTGFHILRKSPQARSLYSLVSTSFVSRHKHVLSIHLLLSGRTVATGRPCSKHFSMLAR